ncbi:sirohydrochlorin chelatase [Streptomyces alboniger]|uniref:Sirohydrochlorin chelatase n=1 Tax=Streptomyces alboniger TaxID=132473 RepID=A0A5J6HCP1_STRAD|nr:sirohydrochlorin chelatase [Streptomyces alboniger]QEV17976.1 sirohydrochlorin chelatase [Streptomyces alboniger]
MTPDHITSQLVSRPSLVPLHGNRRPDSSPTPHTRPTLVLVPHGSRDPRALATVTALADRIREQRPGLAVRLGHIELNQPLLTDALAAQRGGGAVLVPLLLSRGQHVKRDIPAAAAAAPHLETRVAAPLGPHPLLAEALHTRLVQAGWPVRHLGAAARRRHAVVLAAAGSRDPESAVGTEAAAALLADRLGVPVVPAYAAPTPACARTVPEALEALAAEGRSRVAVAAYFTAPGRFATQSAVAAPWIAAAPLGAHPALARLVLHRYDQARTAPPVAEQRRLTAV